MPLDQELNPKIKKDSVAMYLIARDSLNMSPGKLAAQAGHAVEAYYDYILRLNDESSHGRLSSIEELDLSMHLLWKIDDSTKIVLKASEAEFEKVKNLRIGSCIGYLVIDAGYTELPSNTTTLVWFMPMRKSQAPKPIKRLRLY